MKSKLGMKLAGLMPVCLLAAMFTIPGCGGEDASTAADVLEWSYDGPTGPENWASLSEEYKPCANGEQQSPIDITGYQGSDAGPISFSYRGDVKAVRNDGKFVHVDYPPGNTLTVGQQSFDLKSAHLHSPSEHHIDGMSFAAELHLVHGDAVGNLVAVGLLFETGEASPIVQAILDAAPKTGTEVTAGAGLNARDYAPAELGYYRYDGSKTTPPCYEPVAWYVMRELKSVSPEQVDKLLELSGGPNNRPIQPTGNRGITLGGAP